MGFPRRRSLWLKVAILATAVWVTVCFLLYTEDRANAAVQGLAPSGVAAPQMANGFVPAAAALRKETPFNAQPKAKVQAGPEQGNYSLVYAKMRWKRFIIIIKRDQGKIKSLMEWNVGQGLV